MTSGSTPDSALRSIAERVLGRVPSAATYADVRVVRRRHDGLHVEGEQVGQVLTEESEGVGLRVLLDGQWGFACTARLDDLDAIVRRAVDQARAAHGLGPPISLAPAAVVQAVYVTPTQRDPFSVSIIEKVDLLLAAADAMSRAGGPRTVADASMDFYRDEKVFANTEGSRVEQSITESGAGLMATASDGSDVQRRSYPQGVPRAIRGQRGDFATAGYEHIERMDLISAAPRVGEEAVALLHAEPCPVTTTTLIVGGAQMAQLVHECIGHPAELDRALGGEASLAGGTFLEVEQRGTQRFGSDLVNLTADATLAGGLGSFAYDDEGVAAQRTLLVEQGVFVGYMASRESAARLGVASTGAARADGWGRVPLVRMTNVSLEPGHTDLDDMIAGIDDGIFMDMNRSLSIDDQRLSFSMGCEIGWEIKHGRLGRLLKSCSFRGITPQFWAKCDAVANQSSYRLYGIPSCNKGEPLQVAHIGHGTVPARFRDVSVGAR
jgi:TldD protein